MELYFQFPADAYAAKRRTLVRVAKKAVPGALVARIDATNALKIILPASFEVGAAEALLVAWEQECGVRAVETDASVLPLPPIRMQGMAPARGERTVRLSVFIVSLICVALVACILTVGFMAALGGLFADETLGTESERQEDYYGKITLVDQIFKQYSLYDTNGDLLLDEMLKAYAYATGDRYAAYYTAEELDALLADNAAVGVGIGVTIVEDRAAGGIRIVALSKDSPAAAAGILVGDLLISAGEGEGLVTYAEDGYLALVSAMAGEEGTNAVFTLMRDGNILPTFTVERKKVESTSVMGRVHSVENTVGVVLIMQFDLSTPNQFKATMDDLIAKGCTSFVFDVRGNPGGDLESVTTVLSYFLQENDLMVSTVAKSGETVEYRVMPKSLTDDYAGCSIAKEEIGKYRGYPMAVLTNGNTASAAELFTSALRDYSLVTIVGEKTFGKGIIQQIFTLEPYGYSGGLKLTTGYYTPPCGENYDGKGIEPNVPAVLEGAAAEKSPLLLSDTEDTQLAAALGAIQQK